jgi:hypothetical protein
MSDDKTLEGILERLVRTITQNNSELAALKTQTASYESILNEVREHNRMVKESVDWGNLGDDVFKGVASATISKIDETTGAAAKIVQNAKALEEVGGKQFNALEAINITLKGVGERQTNTDAAIMRVNMAADKFRARSIGMVGWMVLAGLITASLGLFGGYFYAMDVTVKAWHSELGADLIGDKAKDYCRYADGKWQVSENGNPACVFWKTPDPE